MNSKRALLVSCILFVVLASGCLSETKTEYICPDGTKVSNPAYCKTEPEHQTEITPIRKTTGRIIRPDLPYPKDEIHFIADVDLKHQLDTSEVKVGFAQKKWKLRRSGNPIEFYDSYGKTVQVYADGKIVLYGGYDVVRPAYFREISSQGGFRKDVISVLASSGQITSADLGKLNDPDEWSFYALDSGTWTYLNFMNPNEITFNFPEKPKHFYIQLKWDEWSDWKEATINGHSINKGKTDFADYAKTGKNFFYIGCDFSGLSGCNEYERHNHWMLINLAEPVASINYKAKNGADCVIENAKHLTEFWNKYK